MKLINKILGNRTFVYSLCIIEVILNLDESSDLKSSTIHFCIECKNEFKTTENIHWEEARCERCSEKNTEAKQ